MKLRNLLAAALVLSLFPLFASAASKCPNITHRLSFGSRGADVKQLQNFLVQQKDLPSGSSSGFFGNLTLVAVKSFQKRNNVVSSGTAVTTGYGAVGKRTSAAISATCLVPTMSTDVRIQDATTTDRTDTSSSYAQSSYGGVAIHSYTQGSYGDPSSGSYAQSSYGVTPGSAVSCTFNDQTIASGSSITAYQSSSVAAGQQCLSETRTCLNGNLSGSYGVATCAVQPLTPETFSMKDYWPMPAEGMAYIKHYRTPNASAGEVDLISRYTNEGGVLKKTDYMANGNGSWIDQWQLKVDDTRGVIEFGDIFPDKNIVYINQKEINWGNVMRIGDTIENSLEMDMTKTTGVPLDSPSKYGYNKLSLSEYIPSVTFDGRTYTNVLHMKLSQSFCKTIACAVAGTDYSYWNLEYYFAPGKGIIKTVYSNLNGVVGGATSAHEAYKDCTVSADKFLCD